MEQFRFSKNSLSKLEKVDSRLQQLALRAIEISPVDFGISWGLRTVEEQQEMFKNKRSKLDGIKKISKHQQGLAIDVFGYKNGKTDYDPYTMDMIHGSFLQASYELKIPFTWGGLWKKFPDSPHFELK